MSDLVGFLWKPLRFVCIAACAIFLAFMCFWGVRFYFSPTPGYDASMFALIGHHMLNGKILYADIFDNKPPGIFIINMLSQILQSFFFPTDNGIVYFNFIRLIETALMALCSFALFRMVFLLSGRRVFPGFFAAFFYLLFLVYNPKLYDGGLLTEEFGGFFIVFGFYLLCEGVLCIRPTLRSLLAFASGITASMAVLIKEPFLFCFIVWFILTVYLLWSRDRAFIVKASIGAMLPVFLLFTYLIVTGSLSAWWDMILFNFIYMDINEDATTVIGSTSSMWVMFDQYLFSRYYIAGALAVCSLVYILRPDTTRFERAFGIASLAFFASGVYAAFMSGRVYGHYTVFSVPAFAILIGLGIGTLMRTKNKQVAFALLLVCGGLTCLNQEQFQEAYIQAQVKKPFKTEPSIIGNYIIQNTTPDDTIYVHCGFPQFYVETQRLAPTRIPIFDPVYYADSDETSTTRYTQMANLIKSKRPKFIIAKQNSNHEPAAFWDVVDSEYEPFIAVYNEYRSFTNLTLYADKRIVESLPTP